MAKCGWIAYYRGELPFLGMALAALLSIFSTLSDAILITHVRLYHIIDWTMIDIVVAEGRLRLYGKSPQVHDLSVRGNRRWERIRRR